MLEDFARTARKYVDDQSLSNLVHLIDALEIVEAAVESEHEYADKLVSVNAAA